MRCPSCHADDDRVMDSRTTEDGKIVRRRRVCKMCGRRYTTKERLEEELRLAVVKAKGHRVRYNRENVYDGVERACHKLPVTPSQIEDLVDKVEEDLTRNHEREVSSHDIGRYVSLHLRQVNEVAYIRFMSVYRKFNTIDEFVDIVQDLQEEKGKSGAPGQLDLF